ncbi:MAG: hypothetical protein PVJ71_00610 [Lysobacterales bacterium]|jgi:hypothetical protein
MAIKLPTPDRLPSTADHYKWRGKPAVVIPGHCGVVFEPSPRAMPWTELLVQGERISARQFEVLLQQQG